MQKRGPSLFPNFHIMRRNADDCSDIDVEVTEERDRGEQPLTLTMEQSDPDPGHDPIKEPQHNAEGTFNLTTYFAIVISPLELTPSLLFYRTSRIYIGPIATEESQPGPSKRQRLI
uniref:Uncharacterized protein LOC114328711 n=1 Tax=Diabrotica virgifera virgifera TaxID=50390 RepID=A0A6P7FBX7_DIAVI